MLRFNYGLVILFLLQTILIQTMAGSAQAAEVGLWTFDEYAIDETLVADDRIADTSGNGRDMRSVDNAASVALTTVAGAPQFGGGTAISFHGNMGDLLEFVPGYNSFNGGGPAASSIDFDIGPTPGAGGCATCIGENYTLEAIVQLPLIPFGDNMSIEGGVMGKGGVHFLSGPEIGNPTDHWGMNVIGPLHLPPQSSGPVDSSRIEAFLSEWIPDTPTGFTRFAKFDRGPIDAGWHHIAITRNRSTDQMGIYVDGALFGGFHDVESPQSINVIPDDTGIGNFVIGARDSDGTTAFRGAIDLVRISDTVLDPADFIINATTYNWGGDASGDWSVPASWSPPIDTPDNNEHTVIFGDVLSTTSRFAGLDASVTVNRIEFNSSTSAGYAVSGPGNIALETKTSDATTPTVEIVDGDHQFQVDVSLNNNATITAGDGTTLDFDGIIALGVNDLMIAAAGGGAMDGMVNINNGVTGTGTLTNNAALGTGNATAIGGSLTSTGTLDIDITPNSTDMFIVAGDATLSGILDIDLQDGFTPTGDITVVTVGGALNAAGLTLGGPDGGLFSLNTSSGNVVLAFSTGPTGDYNLNGLVDGGDFLLWQQTHGDNVTPGTGADGIPDGLIDGLDRTFWESKYGNTVPLAAGANTPVPEPTSGMLVVLASLTSLLRRRK